MSRPSISVLFRGDVAIDQTCSWGYPISISIQKFSNKVANFHPRTLYFVNEIHVCTEKCSLAARLRNHITLLVITINGISKINYTLYLDGSRVVCFIIHFPLPPYTIDLDVRLSRIKHQDSIGKWMEQMHTCNIWPIISKSLWWMTLMRSDFWLVHT